jgi:predicted RNase H-like HicB family nuclease
MSNYRVLVTYDPDRSVFVARAPELEHCTAEGATRAEAVARVDEEIDAQLRNIREHGGRLPVAVDDDGAGLSGELTAKVSRGLHRDLAWQARSEGVELGQLVGEMLAAALEARRQRGGRRPAVANPQTGEPRPDRGPEDGRSGGQRPFRANDRGGGGRYHAIMEDRATFLEYVRGLDSGGQRGPGPTGGPGRRRGRGRPGGPQGQGQGQGQGVDEGDDEPDGSAGDREPDSKK